MKLLFMLFVAFAQDYPPAPPGTTGRLLDSTCGALSMREDHLIHVVHAKVCLKSTDVFMIYAPGPKTVRLSPKQAKQAEQWRLETIQHEVFVKVDAAGNLHKGF